MDTSKATCVFCERNQNEVPLVHFVYKNTDYFICPQHIPVLIHDPQKLAGLIPDADNLQAG